MTHATIDPKSVEAALADPAFSPLTGGPVLIADGSSARRLYASDQALALFGAKDPHALAQRLFAGDEPGARRFAELAASLPPGPPRLERLRFYLGGASEALTFQCKRLDGAAPMLVAVAIGVRPALIAGALAQAAAVPPVAVETEAPMAAPPGNVRFLWKTDADLRFTRFEEAGCEALGCEPAALIGQSMLELAGLPGFDPEGRLCAGLMRRETWSGVEVNWPLGDSNAFAPVVMGALPTFDKERAFSGFSGFGVIHLDRVAERAASRNDELAADIAEETAPEPMTEAEATAAELAEIAAFVNDPALIDAAAADEESEPDAAETAAEIEAELNPPAGREPEQQQATESREAFCAPTAAPLRAANVVALNAWKAGGSGQTPSLPSRPAEPGSETATAEGDEFPSRDGEEEEELVRLTPTERHAFREIARALGAQIEDAKNRHPAQGRRKDDANKNGERAKPVAGEAGSAPAQDDGAPICEPESPPVLAPALGPGRNDEARRLLDRVDAGLMVCRDGEAVFLNKSLLETLGYESFEAFSQAGGIARMFRGRTPDSAAKGGAIAVVGAEGETLALDGRLAAIEWEGAAAILTTFRQPAETELTARIRALELELRVREAEGRELHAILDTATDGVAILDGDGRILGLNRSAEALFGYEQNEVAGEPFTILAATESHPAAIDYLGGLKTNGVRSVLNDGREIIGRARQGGTIPIFMTIGRIGVEPASKFCAVMRDLTQWKNAERELKDARLEAEEASALKSDFLAKISHEIRTPLNAILGFTEVILEERFGPVGNERYKDYLKDIHASGTHVMSLVNDLLDLSKIEAGKLELNFGSVDANRIINECVSIMQAQAIRERVIIRLSLAPRLPNIVADERALRQIVLNLLSNAVKFNQPAGQVIVSTALTDAGAAVIRVRDNGVGMTEKDVEMALEPFRQIQTSRHATGTGLGLPLTKALVEANRAAFTIRSRKGEGTLVEVSFPPSRVLAE